MNPTLSEQNDPLVEHDIDHGLSGQAWTAKNIIIF